MREERVEHFGVLRRHANAGADVRNQRERHLDPAAGHVASEGRLVHHLVQADADEVHEHQLGYGAEPGQRRADGGPKIAHLRDGRVEHALFAELAQQALVLGECAAPGVRQPLAPAAPAAGHVFAQQDDGAVAPHLLAERLVDGVPNVDDAFFRHHT